MKKDLQAKEKEMDQLQEMLVVEALKLSNKTHPSTTIGGECKSKILRFIESDNELTRNLQLDGMTHTEIADLFNLLDFANASKLTGN